MRARISKVAEKEMPGAAVYVYPKCTGTLPVSSGELRCDVQQLGARLSESGFGDYRLRTFGSALLFTTRRHGTTAWAADSTNLTKGAAQ